MIYFGLLFVFLLFSYLLLILPTQWLKVERITYDLGLGKKVLQISDIHIKNLRVNLRTIQNIIKLEKPDYIFLTGDYIDRTEEEFPLLENFLNVLKESNIETYAVLGNHDRYVKDVSSLVSLLKKFDICVLQNEWVEKENFVLIGIDDFCKRYHDIDKSFSFDKNTKKKKIIITHDPSIVDVMNETFHYFMAGHLHGKQVNVPYLFKLKPMGSLSARGIYQGLHEHKNGPIYISKGMGQSRYNIRFMVRSEMTLHYL